MSRASVQLEQVYVVSHDGKDFWIGGDRHSHIPWHKLAACHLYATTEEVLRQMLQEAACEGWHVFAGSSSERRGLGGFTVGIGPWGVRGRVECRRLQSWAIEIDELEDHGTTSGELQDKLRKLVVRLNEGEIGFRTTGLRYLRAVYHKYGKPLEFGEILPRPLPPDVALLCRRAHIGGPIVHARTTLTPWVSVDRKRAYGEVMLGELPSGDPSEVSLHGNGLHRWHNTSLMRMVGIVDATVRVNCGPVVPLLPVLKWHSRFERSKAIYPTGVFRGSFTIAELAHMEREGLGEVQRLHRAITFPSGRPFGPVIRHLRRLEDEGLGSTLSVKRLEHMLYGWCSRTLGFSQFGSASTYREPTVQDLVDSKTLERLTTRVEMRAMGRDPGRPSNSSLQLYEVRGTLTDHISPGAMDRPDRSAWIVSANRILMSELVLHLDRTLKPSRSGAFIGRIYVDGLDIEANPDELKLPPGWQIRGHGPRCNIYRPSILSKQNADGSWDVEDGGLIDGKGATDEQLRQVLRVTPDMDGGAFASGRWWASSSGHDDPRMAPFARSEPIDLAEGTFDHFKWEQEYD